MKKNSSRIFRSMPMIRKSSRRFLEPIRLEYRLVPGMDYRMVKTVDTDAKGIASQPGAINGGILSVHRADVDGAVNYVSVDSIEQASIAKVRARVTKESQPSRDGLVRGADGPARQ